MTDSPKRELHEEHPDPEADRRQKRHRGHGEHDSLAIRSHGQKRFKYEDYTVGIICALEFEMSAVRFMLDNEHPNLNFKHDQNLYVLGELGKLNVVIACLPGNQGKGAAAIVTTNMARTFPGIKLRLMVGIGGGVPSDKHDIRLGDVVISMPDGPYGGVVQYDLGKDTEETFILKGHLSPAPQILRSATVKMRSDHRFRSSKVNEHLRELAENGTGFSDYQRPLTESDILFEADSPHIPGQDTCHNCDRRNEVERSPREPDVPKIHYGLIASGDRVMRSVRKRRLASQGIDDILCFEMEAAGILTEYSCLVIRGISDYADSHKHDAWQHYAAATAAACAKELLSYLGSETSVRHHEPDRMSYDRPRWVPGQTESPFSKQDNNRQLSSLSDIQKQTILKSLKFDQIDSRKMTIKKEHSKTCKWLLKTAEYLQWLDDTKLNDHHGVLWMKGKPGAGKSTLMKFALNSWKRRKDTTVLSFFFNARGDDLEKSTIGMYRSLLWQLLTHDPNLMCVFDSPEIPTWDDEDPQWTLELLQGIFGEAVRSSRQCSVVCFIDALDECEEQQIRDMLEVFNDIGESAIDAGNQILVLFSSRHYPHITFEKGLELVLDGQEGHRQDIANYINSELKIPECRDAKQIKDEVQAKASGVFMWVVLVVRILNKEYDAGRVRNLRQKLRQIPSDLHELFRDILKRDGDNRDKLLLCIQWILFARTPLKPEELYYALLSWDEPADLGTWDADEITHGHIQRNLLDCSKGLAELTPSKTPTVQFIHESVRDFFLKENGFAEIWQDIGSNFQGRSHERLKQCCLNYLNIDTSSALHIPDHLPKASLPEMAALRQSATDSFPFLKYAVCNILYHADMAEGDGFPQEDFLQNFPLADWNRLHNLFERYGTRRHTSDVSLLYILAEYDLSHLVAPCQSSLSWFETGRERYGPPLFAALARGNKKAVEAFLRDCARGHPSESKLCRLCYQYIQDSIGRSFLGHNFKFSHQRSVMSYIAELGDEKLLAILLETGKLIPDSEDKILGRTPLSWAAKKGHEAVINLLLGDQRVDPKAGFGRALLEAAENGHEAIVSRLLDDRWVDPGFVLGSSLSGAAGNGHEAVVKLLLADPRIDPDARDDEGAGLTPLSWAAKKGHEAVINLLLGDQRVDPKAGFGRALLEAAENGHKTIVSLLLADPRIDPSVKSTVWEQTPLSGAAENGHEAVVSLLLADPRIDPSVKSIVWEQTPLSCAAKNGHGAIVSLLLADPRIDPNSQNINRQTPLSCAAENGHEAVVSLLLADPRVDPNTQSGNGKTPLSYAATNGHKEVVKVLLGDPRMDPNAGERTSLSWAAETGHKEVADLLRAVPGSRLL